MGHNHILYIQCCMVEFYLFILHFCISFIQINMEMSHVLSCNYRHFDVQKLFHHSVDEFLCSSKRQICDTINNLILFSYCESIFVTFSAPLWIVEFCLCLLSPEVVKSEPYGEKADVWAAGCILYQMATLNPPFYSTNMLSLATKVCRFAR